MYAEDKSSDISIVEKIKRRDPSGLAEAYDRYSTIAFSLVVRITRNSGVAEDLVQELFLRLWNRIHDFDVNRGSLNSWVVTIARNLAIDYVRSSHSRFAARLLPLDQTNQSSNSYKPETIDVDLDNSKAVMDALSSLTSNQRRVLEMAYFEGFSQSEIASRLQEPLGTVKSWVRAALSRLRVALLDGGKK